MQLYDQAKNGAISDWLTPRQAEIAHLVAHGLSNCEIAGSLKCSDKSVASSLQKIYRRLGVYSRAELLLLALQRGWVKLEHVGAALESRIAQEARAAEEES